MLGKTGAGLGLLHPGSTKARREDRPPPLGHCEQRPKAVILCEGEQSAGHKVSVPYVDGPPLSVAQTATTCVAQSEGPYLSPLMTPAQKTRYCLLLGIWLLALAYFWVWWLRPEHNIGTFSYVLNLIVIGWLTLLPLYFVLILPRARVPGRIPVPAGYRVAMVVTKAPSEPFPIVRETLEAMLRQAYPHDTWLADEDPSPETISWCREHGVMISTRKDRSDYHRTDWPRRTKCKEGNLAFFYDHYGYANYDFVVQLDADHVPTDCYLEEMLRGFADPKVG
jgi:cellulose synthase (UDP-forming)